MSSAVCVTVDVEDFYDGMAALGHQVARPPGEPHGLASLLEHLESAPTKPKVTLFVVGNHAPAVRAELAAFATAGHEIASHGPDHGRLPSTTWWSGCARGARPSRTSWASRCAAFARLASTCRPGDWRATARRWPRPGYHYVSDTSRLGPTSPVTEVPVLSWRGLRVGGGSYQRLLPFSAVAAATRRGPGPGCALLPLL